MNDQVTQALIEPATGDDLEAILRIELEAFTAPWTRKMFEVELGQNQFGRLHVARGTAEAETRPVLGYVCFWIVFDEFRLMNLAVAIPARRQGIGGELLRHALAMGRRQGAIQALMEVRASNATALSLYERTGFFRTAVRRNYYTKPVEDAVLMEMGLLTDSHVANSE